MGGGRCRCVHVRVSKPGQMCTHARMPGLVQGITKEEGFILPRFIIMGGHHGWPSCPKAVGAPGSLPSYTPPGASLFANRWSPIDARDGPMASEA